MKTIKVVIADKNLFSKYKWTTYYLVSKRENWQLGDQVFIDDERTAYAGPTGGNKFFGYYLSDVPDYKGVRPNIKIVLAEMKREMKKLQELLLSRSQRGGAIQYTDLV